MRHRTTFIAIALLLGPGGLAAQQHQHGGDTTRRGMMMDQRQGMMGEGMMPGMAIRGFAPEQVLASRGDLGLTDAQIEQLEQLQAEAARAHDAAMASHARYREQLMEALQAEAPDPTKIRGLMAGAHESMGQAHWAEMEATLKAMGVLTDAQRAQVRKAPGAGMQHRHGQDHR